MEAELGENGGEVPRPKVDPDCRQTSWAAHLRLKQRPTRQWPACRAIGGAGEIFAARDQISIGKVSWSAGRVRPLEIRKLDALAFGKAGGIAGAKSPPSDRHDRQDDDRQDRGFVVAAHLATSLRIALSYDGLGLELYAERN